jgi:hypothetical protein
MHSDEKLQRYGNMCFFRGAACVERIATEEHLFEWVLSMPSIYEMPRRQSSTNQIFGVNLPA